MALGKIRQAKWYIVLEMIGLVICGPIGFISGIVAIFQERAVINTFNIVFGYILIGAGLVISLATSLMSWRKIKDITEEPKKLARHLREETESIQEQRRLLEAQRDALEIEKRKRNESPSVASVGFWMGAVCGGIVAVFVVVFAWLANQLAWGMFWACVVVFCGGMLGIPAAQLGSRLPGKDISIWVGGVVSGLLGFALCVVFMSFDSQFASRYALCTLPIVLIAAGPGMLASSVAFDLRQGEKSKN